MANQIEGWSKQGHARVRIRAGGGKQLRLNVAIPDGVPEAKRESAARARLQQLELMASALVGKGLTKSAAFLLRKAAAQKDEAAFDLCLQTAGALAPMPEAQTGKPRTVRDLGQLWTSGELHRMYPDHVKLKASSGDDESRLGHMYHSIGDVPLTEFSREDYWTAMRNLPPTTRRSTTRRAYAQCLVKVLRWAVLLDIIPVQPIPKELMPRVVKGDIVFPYLYPDEDLRLLQTVPAEWPKLRAAGVDADWYLIARAFLGVLNREGMRISEALGMQWKLQDFRHGVINIGPRKNGRTGMWPAAEGTLEALEVLRDRFGGDGPFERLPKDDHWAWRLRQMLLAAGLDRYELHHDGPGRRRMRGHDMRSTFVTLALAWRGPWGEGRSENWVSTRTGHMSSDMVNGYKRQAASVAELGHTSFLLPLDVALGLRVLADGPAEAVVGERQLESNSSATGESSTWGETISETESPPRGASPGAFTSETLSENRGVAKTGLEPVRPCGRRILKTLQEPGTASFPLVPMDGTTSAEGLDSAPEAPSRQPEADPKSAFLEQLRAAAHAAVQAGDWAAVGELGKLIDSSQGKAGAGTTRAPAEAAPAPSSAGTSALADTVQPVARVVDLSSHRRGGR